jgi:hypothetical protein
MRPVICFGIAVFALIPSRGMAESKAMQMANQNLARYGLQPGNMRLPMGGGRTYVSNQNYVPGVGFSSGFGVINPRGQSFYSGQSSSFRGGGQSAVLNYSRPGFSYNQSWVQGGGRSGSAFGFSNGQVSGGSSFLNNRNTGVKSFSQGFSNGRFASSQGWVQGGGLSGSRFAFSNGQVSGGSSFLSNNNTGVRSFAQGFGNGRFASSQGWVQGGGLSGSRFAYSNGQVSGGSSFLNNRNTGVMSSRQAISNSRTSAGNGIRFVSSGGGRQRLFGGRGR